MSFLFCFLKLLTALEVRKVVWEDTYIRVPLLASVEEYKNIPSAKLYIDDTLYEDPDMYYMIGVSSYLLSGVDTNAVGKYHVKYRVHFPSLGYMQTETIIFEVYDDIAPYISSVPTKRYPLGTKTLNLTEGLIYSDNYNKFEELSLHILGANLINSNVVGKYQITYQVVDKSGNIGYKETHVEIYDDVAPTIKLKKELELEFGSHFRWNDFFDIKDNYDLVINVIIDDSKVTYQELGSYPIKISAKDRSDNIFVTNEIIKILDKKPPEIFLVSQIPKITFCDSSVLLNLQKYIILVKDDYDFLTISDVSISHKIEIDVLGDYDIYYELSDKSGNQSIKKLKVSVVDDVAPQILKRSPDIALNVFSVKPIWRSFFIFSDNYNSEYELKIDFIDNVVMNKVGVYTLNVIAIDEHKNKIEVIVDVKVIDNEIPVITQNSELIIFDFEYHDFTNYFSFSDNYDSELEVNIDYSLVNYIEVGEYEVYVSAADKSGNLSRYQTAVYVIDNEAPILLLERELIYLDYRDHEPNYIDFVKEVSDNYDFLTFDDILVTDLSAEMIVGEKEVTFFISDSSGNETKESILVKIDDSVPPVITGDSVYYYNIGAEIDLYSLIVIKDAHDGVISTKNRKFVALFPQFIDTSLVGIHNINYFVTDSRGNIATFSTKIIINKSDYFFWPSLIPYAVIGFIGTFIIIFLYKRRKI